MLLNCVYSTSDGFSLLFASVLLFRWSRHRRHWLALKFCRHEVYREPLGCHALVQWTLSNSATDSPRPPTPPWGFFLLESTVAKCLLKEGRLIVTSQVKTPVVIWYYKNIIELNWIERSRSSLIRWSGSVKRSSRIPSTISSHMPEVTMITKEN